eukprot:3248014-Rhodomonas_salina.3
MTFFALFYEKSAADAHAADLANVSASYWDPIGTVVDGPKVYRWEAQTTSNALQVSAAVCGCCLWMRACKDMQGPELVVLLGQSDWSHRRLRLLRPDVPGQRVLEGRGDVHCGHRQLQCVLPATGLRQRPAVVRLRLLDGGVQ